MRPHCLGIEHGHIEAMPLIFFTETAGMGLTIEQATRSRQSPPHTGEIEILFAQTLLLFRLLRLGLRLDSRSLRNLARLAEKIAVAEDRRP
jgi:hypothetical protein